MLNFSDLNLIDWSPSNVLAVALNKNVYLWDAGSGKIEQLLTLEGADYVCSLGWIQEGNYLAVGTSMGVTQVIILSLNTSNTTVIYACKYPISTGENFSYCN